MFSILKPDNVIQPSSKGNTDKLTMVLAGAKISFLGGNIDTTVNSCEHRINKTIITKTF